MASLKWLKISSSLFKDAKITKILSMKGGEKTFLLWLQLLCLAAELNMSGFFMDNECTYTLNLLAKETGRHVPFLVRHIDILLRNELLGLEDGAYYIVNWEKYQSTDRLEKIRENDRLKKQRQRARKKELDKFVPGDVPGDVPQQNKNKKENKNILLYNTPNEWEQIIAHYCADLPESVRQETNCLLQSFLTSLKNAGKLLSPTALTLTLEKLVPMAKESGLSLPAYLKEVLCRGWLHFYPIPEYQHPKPKKEASYSIEEVERLIMDNERGLKQ